MATDPRHRARTRPRPLLVALIACAYVLLLAGTGVAAASLGAEKVVTIAATVEAGDRRVPVRVADGETVLSVLTTAGVVPRNGRLLGAKDGRVLDPDHDPARFTVGG